MTDLTPAFNALLSEKGSSTISPTSKRTPSPDEFLKEAYRINNHISSLLAYLHKTRPAYLSITPNTSTSNKRSSSRSTTSSPVPLPVPAHGHAHAHAQQQQSQAQQQQQLTDTDRDNIDHSTSLLLHDLNTSITTLSSAETLRHETASNLLAKKYGHGAAAKLLWKWAGGGSLTTSTSTTGDVNGIEDKKPEQHLAEEKERYLASTRESVLWFLRRGLDEALAVQRGMVERRIERIREKEKSVLYKASHGPGHAPMGSTGGMSQQKMRMMLDEEGESAAVRGSAMDAKEVAAIEAELSPEQLQLFAEENDSMVRYYEETLSKVQNAEKSLLEIASLQQTLVTHLSTQEEYVEQLVVDASSTETNIGQGNRELKRASERRSTAQAVFWGTVGLCTGLVVWDLIF